MKDITIESNLKSLIPLSLGRKEECSVNGDSFGKLLKNSMEEVNQLQNEADRSIEQLVAGESKNLHETMIAMEKANISFRLMLEVRNKIIEAYQDVMRMQV
ncbi:MAG: flagellar hook-basal body complex protein FliE [Deltaproteobacteria bacterium]|nr:flagellar hook-basal body complex protein FliE [Deltaproteobacteria bacterium]